MDIILFGMQGSGKGTQGRILAERYKLIIFEMGGELRKLIGAGVPLGQKIKAVVQRGDLVDDDTVMEVVAHFLALVPKEQRVLFDGVPRTPGQSEKFLKILKEHCREVFALVIKISKKEAAKRLTERRICAKCKEVYPVFYQGKTCGACSGELITRHDDNAEAITKRLENFEKETLPVIKFFAEIDRLIEVDGERPIPDVTEEMIEKAAYLFT